MHKNLISLIVIFLFSCHSADTFQVTKSGLQYLVLKEGNGIKPLDGQYLLFHVQLRNANDSLIFTSDMTGELKKVLYVDSLVKKDGGLGEALTMMTKGDSIDFRISSNTLYDTSNMPEGIEANTMLSITLSLREVMHKKEFLSWLKWKNQEKAKRMQQPL